MKTLIVQKELCQYYIEPARHKDGKWNIICESIETGQQNRSIYCYDKETAEEICRESRDCFILENRNPIIPYKEVGEKFSFSYKHNGSPVTVTLQVKEDSYFVDKNGVKHYADSCSNCVFAKYSGGTHKCTFKYLQTAQMNCREYYRADGKKISYKQVK